MNVCCKAELIEFVSCLPQQTNQKCITNPRTVSLKELALVVRGYVCLGERQFFLHKWKIFVDSLIACV